MENARCVLRVGVTEPAWPVEAAAETPQQGAEPQRDLAWLRG
jgi:hypothetical protein